MLPLLANLARFLIRSITFSDKLYLKIKLSPKDTAEYTGIKINLKTNNNILKLNMRQANILYYQNQFDVGVR